MMVMTMRLLKLHLLPLLLLSGACVHAESYDAERVARHVASLALTEQHGTGVSAQVRVIAPWALNALRSVSAGIDPHPADPDADARNAHNAVTLGLRN